MAAHFPHSFPMRLACLILAAAVPLAGCGLIHKIDIQQGNFVTPESTAKLKKGMTKSEVRQLLGTPLLTDAFHANRWDYYFSHQKGGKMAERTRFSVFFEDEKLVAVTGDVKPAGATPSAAPPPSAAAASPPPAAPASAPAAKSP